MQRYTCEQLLADPWVSGEHFQIVKDRAETAAHAAEEVRFNPILIRFNPI